MTNYPLSYKATIGMSRTTQNLIPPLANGDRLSRAEFERRYKAQTHIKKAELVEGVVYMPSPVHYQNHGVLHANIIGWLMQYRAATPGIQVADNVTVRLDLDNEVQPDVIVRLEEQLGGQSTISEDDYIEGPPELIVEIAASSASYDMHDKLQVYRRNRVLEYAVFLAYEQAIAWYVWEDEQYKPLSVDHDGVIRSRVFPGLHFHPDKFWADDLTGLLANLQEGMQTAVYQQFVTSLKNRIT